MPAVSSAKQGAAAPSEDDVQTALARVLGDEKGTQVWQEVCDTAQIPRPGPALDLEQVALLADHLKQRSDIASVVGNSLSVKIRTHKHRS